MKKSTSKKLENAKVGEQVTLDDGRIAVKAPEIETGDCKGCMFSHESGECDLYPAGPCCDDETGWGIFIEVKAKP